MALEKRTGMSGKDKMMKNIAISYIHSERHDALLKDNEQGFHFVSSVWIRIGRCQMIRV